jgi:hypothetical protein
MLVGPQRVPHGVGPPVERGSIGYWLAVDLDDTVHEIDDPVFGQAGAGIEATLVLRSDARDESAISTTNAGLDG